MILANRRMSIVVRNEAPNGKPNMRNSISNWRNNKLSDLLRGLPKLTEFVQGLRRSRIACVVIVAALSCGGAHEALAEGQTDTGKINLRAGENEEMLQEVRRLLDQFGYDAGSEPSLDSEIAEWSFRHSVEEVQSRLGWRRTGTVDADLIEQVRAAERLGSFHCPGGSTIPALSELSQAQIPRVSVYFYISGRHPARYALQMLERLDRCAPEVMANMRSGLQEDVLIPLVEGGLKLPADDPVASQIAGRLLSGTNASVLGAADNRPEPGRPSLYIHTGEKLYTRLYTRSFDQQELREKYPYSNKDALKDLCSELGYTKTCGRILEQERGKSDVNSASMVPRPDYWAEVDHYEAVLFLSLPVTHARMLAEDMSQEVPAINPELKDELIRRPIVRVIDGVEAIPLNDDSQNDNSCPRGSVLKCLEVTGNFLRKKVGWPNVNKPQVNSSGAVKSVISIVDQSLFLDIVKHSDRLKAFCAKFKLEDESCSGAKAYISFDTLKIHHPYLRAKGESAIQIIERTVEKGDDPGHSLFAAGLIRGSLGHKKNWYGLGPKTSKIQVVNIQGIESILANSKRKAQGNSKSNVKFDINVVISDAPKSCDDSSVYSWSNFKHELRVALSRQESDPARALFVIAAPYNCHPQKNYTKTPACEGYQIDSMPLVCSTMTNSNHAIIVASADEQLNDLHTRHLKSSELKTERFLLAPGCGLVSADFDFEGKVGIAGARLRGCGSSYAAPIVGALAARMVDNELNLQGVDVKAYLLATSTPYSKPDTREKAFGLVNWTRGKRTRFEKNVTVWFDAIDVFYTEDEEKVLKNVCHCISDDRVKNLYVEECQSPGDLLRCQGDSLKIRESSDLLAQVRLPEDVRFAGIRRYQFNGDHKYDAFFFHKMRTAGQNQQLTPIQNEGFVKNSEVSFAWGAGECQTSGYTNENLSPCMQLCSREFGCIRVNPYRFSHIISGDARFSQRKEHVKSSIVRVAVKE